MNAYIQLDNILSFSQNDIKNFQKLIVTIFGIMIKTVKFMVKLIVNKSEKVVNVITKAFGQKKISFMDI